MLNHTIDKILVFCFLSLTLTGCLEGRYRNQTSCETTKPDGTKEVKMTSTEVDIKISTPPITPIPPNKFLKKIPVRDGNILQAEANINSDSFTVIPFSGTVVKDFTIDFSDVDDDNFYILSINNQSPTQIAYATDVNLMDFIDLTEITSVTISGLSFLDFVDFSIVEDELNNPNNRTEIPPFDFNQGVVPTCEIVQVSEATSTFSLLSLGILGVCVTLKRKVKSTNSIEKEPTKVG